MDLIPYKKTERISRYRKILYPTLGLVGATLIGYALTRAKELKKDQTLQKQAKGLIAEIPIITPAITEVKEGIQKYILYGFIGLIAIFIIYRFILKK
jgi:hypothetical protein